MFSREKVEGLKLRHATGEPGQQKKCRIEVGISKDECNNFTCDRCYRTNTKKHTEAVVRTESFTCTEDCRLTVIAATGKIITLEEAEYYDCSECIKLIKEKISVDFKGVFNELSDKNA